MRWLLFIAVILTVSVVLGLGLENDPGLVIIRFAKWRIDLPLWLMVTMVLLFYVAMYYLLRIVGGVLDTPKFFSDLTADWRKNRAKRLSHQGFIALAEGNWQRAEKQLIQAAPQSEVPLLNYLSAAQAAQAVGAEKRRDEYIRMAHESSEDADVAVGLTQAQLQYRHGQYEQSLATLKRLLHFAPYHPYVLKLVMKIYVQLKDWQHLRLLLPKLRKNNIISANQADDLERQVYQEMLKAACRQQTDEELKQVWLKMPKRLQTDSDIAYTYANALNDYHHPQEAESIIRQALKKEWRDSLVVLYGAINHPTPDKLIVTAEGWLKSHPDSAGLLLTLGRLCIQNHLWGKAQRYLEASLSIQTNPEAYSELAYLFEKLDKPELAQSFYRKGLMLAAPPSGNETDYQFLQTEHNVVAEVKSIEHE